MASYQRAMLTGIVLAVVICICVAGTAIFTPSPIRSTSQIPLRRPPIQPRRRPYCFNEKRRYVPNRYCQRIYPWSKTCKFIVVQCPIYSCIEMEFLKTEKEIRSTYDPKGAFGRNVMFRKLPPGSVISFNGSRVEILTPNGQPLGQVINVTAAPHPGFENDFACITTTYVNPDATYIEVNGDRFELVTIPETCGGPFHQPVIYAECENPCCNSGVGHCSEVSYEIKYLVKKPGRRGGTKVVSVATPLCCECFNIGFPCV